MVYSESTFVIEILSMMPAAQRLMQEHPMIFPVLVRLKRKLMLFPFEGVLGKKVQPSVAFAMIKRSGKDHRSKKERVACRCLRQKIKWKCLELKISDNLLKVLQDEILP